MNLYCVTARQTRATPNALGVSSRLRLLRYVSRVLVMPGIVLMLMGRRSIAEKRFAITLPFMASKWCTNALNTL